MEDTELRRRIEGLLLEAGRAHHEAFIDADGVDPEWPIWYAGHLLEKLNRLLGTSLTRSEPVYWLVRADRERNDRAPDESWPAYYATLLAEHLT